MTWVLIVLATGTTVASSTHSSLDGCRAQFAFTQTVLPNITEAYCQNGHGDRVDLWPR